MDCLRPGPAIRGLEWVALVLVPVRARLVVRLGLLTWGSTSFCTRVLWISGRCSVFCPTKRLGFGMCIFVHAYHLPQWSLKRVVLAQ